MFTLAGFACVVMVYFGFDYIGECMSRSVNDVRAVTIPKWPVFVIIPIGSLLLAIQLFRMGWSRVTENRTGK